MAADDLTSVGYMYFFNRTQKGVDEICCEFQLEGANCWNFLCRIGDHSFQWTNYFQFPSHRRHHAGCRC